MPGTKKVPPLVPVSPLRHAGELNHLSLNLRELRLFIVDCLKEGKTEIPLGDFIYACRVFAHEKGEESESL
jgi:hypothetical protein